MKYYIIVMYDIVTCAKRFCDLEVLVFINCVGVASEFHYFNRGWNDVYNNSYRLIFYVNK